MIKKISMGLAGIALAASLAGCSTESTSTTDFKVTTTEDDSANDKAEAPTEIDRSGTLYTDDECGKMSIVGDPDHYDIVVEWSFNPGEMTVWTFSGTFDTSGAMHFEDCGRVTTSYFENGEVNEFTTDFLYAVGSLSDDGNGGLVLNIPQDSDISGSVFR